MFESNTSLITQKETETQQECEIPEVTHQVNADPVLELGSPTFPVLRGGCSPHNASSHHNKETHLDVSKLLELNLAQEENTWGSFCVGASRLLSPLHATCPLPCPPNPIPTTYKPCIQQPREPAGANYACCDPFIPFFVCPTPGLVCFCLQLPAPAAPFGGLPEGYWNLFCPTRMEA